MFMFTRQADGSMLETDFDGNPIVKSPAAVADPPAADVPLPATASAALPKTAVRVLYESAVDAAWLAYNDAIGQVYQQYNDAFALGKVEREDGSQQVRNSGLVKCWEKLFNTLDMLWVNYSHTGDGGSRLESILIRAWKSPGGYIPLTDDGRTTRMAIKASKPHAVYVGIDNLFTPTGLYCHKFHNGYRVLAATEDVATIAALLTPIPQPLPTML